MFKLKTLLNYNSWQCFRFDPAAHICSLTNVHPTPHLFCLFISPSLFLGLKMVIISILNIGQVFACFPFPPPHTPKYAWECGRVCVLVCGAASDVVKSIYSIPPVNKQTFADISISFLCDTSLYVCRVPVRLETTSWSWLLGHKYFKNEVSHWDTQRDPLSLSRAVPAYGEKCVSVC